MALKTKVVVSRKWHKPNVEAFIDHHEVGTNIDLEDFIKAVVEEVGNPALLLTKAALQKQLLAATEKVLHEMKEATAKVV